MPGQTDTPAFAALLEFLKRTRGFDFSGYKPASLQRRIHRRMQQIPITTIEEYTDYLEVHPEEFARLFDTILINVTDFFRDPPAWEYLSREIIPQILVRKTEGEPIRLWSAGCAAGQEAYSLAMLFAEAMGVEAFRQRVKIYATDADEQALAQARLAGYPAKNVESVPAPLLKKYFEFANGHYTFRADLRRSVIFGRHDLVQDAPISRVDLLVCRNTLMYFNAETQGRILARLHFGLGKSGYLFLGKAEMMITRSDLFVPVNMKFRIFAKAMNDQTHNRLLDASQIEETGAGVQLAQQVRFRDAVIEAAPIAEIVIDGKGALVFANERARSMFGLNLHDVGRPLQDLEISYRPVELRSLLEQAYVEGHVVGLSDIQRISAGGETQYLDLHIAPLYSSQHESLGAIITFVDVTHSHRLQEDLLRSTKDLEAAYEELQSTNEELETTNEELQSGNEELETTNEELQSANEELETMNEELQSSNEELQTVNEELRERTDEFNQTNMWLQSVLSIPPSSLIVVDHKLKVILWNRRAEEMWGLRPEEVRGKSLFDLDIGLPVESLRTAIRACLDGTQSETTVVLDSHNRRYKPFKCQVSISPFGDAASAEFGVTLIMEDVTERERLALALQQNEGVLRGLVENMPALILAQDGHGQALYWSPEAERLTGWSASEIVGNPAFLELLFPDPKYRARILEELRALGDNYINWKTRVTGKDGQVHTISWSSRARQMQVPEWPRWAVGTDMDEPPARYPEKS